MATQTVEFLAVYGSTLTARLYAVGGSTIIQTASAVTEISGKPGVYLATFTDAPAAEYELHAYLTAGTVPVARWYVTLTLTTATFATYDGPAKLAPVTHTGARIPFVTLVDTTTVNTDMRGTNNALLAADYVAPLNTAGTAAAVWDALFTAHTTAGTYGGRIVRSTNSNVEVFLTGGPTPHIAADVHAFQSAVITSAAFAANWLTAAGTAADYIAELQTAIGTAANQAIVLDRTAYTLTALAGACSDAQTAAETYVLALNGNTFTVDYSGLDASGNRGATTLSKV